MQLGSTLASAANGWQKETGKHFAASVLANAARDGTKGTRRPNCLEGAGRCATRAALRSQHHDDCAHLHPTVEVDHILIGQPNATRRNRMADPSGLVRTVDAIERVL